MNEPPKRTSLLLKYYHRYLSDGNTAQFIASIAPRFSSSTIQRLMVSGSLEIKRAAALSLGLLGSSDCVGHLGPLLRSQDRRLRLVADDALRSIAAREGSTEQRQILEKVIRCNECGDFRMAYDLASEAIENFPQNAELYHQRSLASFQLDLVVNSIQDCLDCLKLNRYHYAAMVGLGYCYLELEDLMQALYWFRQALDVYPDIEPVRLQIMRLESSIQEL